MSFLKEQKNTPQACMKSATCCGMELARSAVWNHHEVMYGINPKEKCTLARDAIRLRRLHTRLRRDYIPILRIG